MTRQPTVGYILLTLKREFYRTCCISPAIDHHVVGNISNVRSASTEFDVLRAQITRASKTEVKKEDDVLSADAQMSNAPKTQGKCLLVGKKSCELHEAFQCGAE
jgi:hypothetical protein